MIKYVKIIVFLMCVSGFSQSEMLKGKITADSLDGAAINIVNLTKKKGTTNNKAGYFQIMVNVGDTIYFSSIQYKIKQIIIKDQDLQKEIFEVALEMVVTDLPEVTVSDIDLSGNISEDAENIPVETFYDNASFGIPGSRRPPPTPVERKIYTARSGVLDLPLNMLSGRLKKLKKLKAIDDLDVIVNRGERTFSLSFFIKDLGLPEALISDFVYYCAEDNYFKNLLGNSKRLSLLEFFQEKVISYKKLKEIP